MCMENTLLEKLWVIAYSMCMEFDLKKCGNEHGKCGSIK